MVDLLMGMAMSRGLRKVLRQVRRVLTLEGHRWSRKRSPKEGGQRCAKAAKALNGTKQAVIGAEVLWGDLQRHFLAIAMSPERLLPQMLFHGGLERHLLEISMTEGAMIDVAVWRIAVVVTGEGGAMRTMPTPADLVVAMTDRAVDTTGVTAWRTAAVAATAATIGVAVWRMAEAVGEAMVTTGAAVQKIFVVEQDIAIRWMIAAAGALARVMATGLLRGALHHPAKRGCLGGSG
jgi:hypothetical protein